LQRYARPGGDSTFAVIPNWERSEAFPAGNGPPPWEGAGIDLAGRFIVLYPGNAGYGHDLRTVVEAAERLRGEPVTLLFVGGGTRHAWLRREAARRNLDTLALHEYVPPEQRRAVLARADLALISLDERALGVMSPSKLHSCLGAALPVLYIGPAGSNVDEAIDRFGCGLRLSPGDATALADTIRDLARDAPRIIDLRRRARLAFERAYCDQATLPRFDDLLADLAGTEAGTRRRAA
jgi:glycosyltransferase involved in cell wall biosynthesis